MSDCRFGVSPVNYPDPDPEHLPRDLANVNEWKIMFDPYISSLCFVTVCEED